MVLAHGCALCVQLVHCADLSRLLQDLADVSQVRFAELLALAIDVAIVAATEVDAFKGALLFRHRVGEPVECDLPIPLEKTTLPDSPASRSTAL